MSQIPLVKIDREGDILDAYVDFLENERDIYLRTFTQKQLENVAAARTELPPSAEEKTLGAKLLCMYFACLSAVENGARDITAGIYNVRQVMSNLASPLRVDLIERCVYFPVDSDHYLVPLDESDEFTINLPLRHCGVLMSGRMSFLELEKHLGRFVSKPLGIAKYFDLYRWNGCRGIGATDNTFYRKLWLPWNVDLMYRTPFNNMLDARKYRDAADNDEPVFIGQRNAPGNLYDLSIEGESEPLNLIANEDLLLSMPASANAAFNRLKYHPRIEFVLDFEIDDISEVYGSENIVMVRARSNGSSEGMYDRTENMPSGKYRKMRQASATGLKSAHRLFNHENIKSVSKASYLNLGDGVHGVYEIIDLRAVSEKHLLHFADVMEHQDLPIGSVILESVDDQYQSTSTHVTYALPYFGENADIDLVPELTNARRKVLREFIIQQFRTGMTAATIKRNLTGESDVQNFHIVPHMFVGESTDTRIMTVQLAAEIVGEIARLAMMHKHVPVIHCASPYDYEIAVEICEHTSCDKVVYDFKGNVGNNKVCRRELTESSIYGHGHEKINRSKVTSKLTSFMPGWLTSARGGCRDHERNDGNEFGNGLVVQSDGCRCDSSGRCYTPDGNVARCIHPANLKVVRISHSENSNDWSNANGHSW